MKWSHGHSIGTGALLGLSIAVHGWLILSAGLVVGWFARDLYSGARFIARRIKRGLV